MITIYLEGVWNEIITQKGFDLFEQRGIKLIGNLLKPKSTNLKTSSYVDLVVATNGDPAVLSWAYSHQVPVIFYTLFPDLITGWDYDKNKYKESLVNDFEDKVKNTQNDILVNSEFTKKLLKDRFKLPINMSLCYLGIDSKSISAINATGSDRLRVLWNHMWRKDKGFIHALKITTNLANKYSNIDFYVGRKEDWGGGNIHNLQAAYANALSSIKKEKLKNICFIDKFKTQINYWRFLKSVDISFSCSFHETFGISMLEQEAAGIACVVPNIEAYPEIHKGALQSPLSSIQNNLEELIINKAKRNKVSNSCKKNAVNYSIEKFVDNLTSHIKKVL